MLGPLYDIILKQALISIMNKFIAMAERHNRYDLFGK